VEEEAEEETVGVIAEAIVEVEEVIVEIAEEVVEAIVEVEEVTEEEEEVEEIEVDVEVTDYQTMIYNNAFKYLFCKAIYLLFNNQFESLKSILTGPYWATCQLAIIAFTPLKTSIVRISVVSVAQTTCTLRTLWSKASKTLIECLT